MTCASTESLLIRAQRVAKQLCGARSELPSNFVKRGRAGLTQLRRMGVLKVAQSRLFRNTISKNITGNTKSMNVLFLARDLLV